MKKIFISALLLGAFVVPSVTFAEMTPEEMVDEANNRVQRQLSRMTSEEVDEMSQEDYDRMFDKELASIERRESMSDDEREELEERVSDAGLVGAINRGEINIDDAMPDVDRGVAQVDIVESDDEE